MMCHCGQGEHSRRFPSLLVLKYEVTTTQTLNNFLFHLAMCYICRTPIENHNHFSNTCVLFDDTIKRNADDVAAAEKVARAAAPEENQRTGWFWL